MDFSNIPYRSAAAGLQRRYEELSRLDLNWYPNAAYDLLRTVLECTIKNFFEVQSHNPLPPRAQLGDCIRSLLTHFKKSDGEQDMVRLITALNQRGGGIAEQFIGTAEALNHLNHNQHAFVVKAEVHTGWDHMIPVLSRLLEEIAGTVASGAAERL